MASTVEDIEKATTKNDEKEEKKDDGLKGLFDSATEFSGTIPNGGARGKYDVKPAMDLAQRTIKNSKNYLYPLEKVADLIGFDPHKEYVDKKTGATKSYIAVLPWSIKKKVEEKYNNIGFKRLDLEDGTMGVLVYKK